MVADLRGVHRRIMPAFSLGMVGGCANGVPCDCGGESCTIPLEVCVSDGCTYQPIYDATITILDGDDETIDSCVTIDDSTYDDIVKVQSPAASTGNSGTASGTYSSTGAGNLLVAAVVSRTVTVDTPSGWTLAAKNETSATKCYLFYRANNPGGITSFSTSLSASNRWVVMLAEYSGVATSSPLDQADTASVGDPPVTVGPITTTTPKQLLISVISDLDYDDTFVASGDGFAILSQADNGFAEGVLLERVVASTGSYSATLTAGGRDGVIASFKAKVLTPGNACCSFTLPDDGEYTIRVEADGYATTSRTIDAACEGSYNENIEMFPSEFCLTVTGCMDRPVENADVTIDGPSGVITGLTNEDGRFCFTLSRSGEHTYDVAYHCYDPIDGSFDPCDDSEINTGFDSQYLENCCECGPVPTGPLVISDEFGILPTSTGGGGVWNAERDTGDPETDRAVSIVCGYNDDDSGQWGVWVEVSYSCTEEGNPPGSTGVGCGPKFFPMDCDCDFSGSFSFSSEDCDPGFECEGAPISTTIVATS